jgi:4-amino-4-deoxy-L-arabinose transferase-like glycosyltransferase
MPPSSTDSDSDTGSDSGGAIRHPWRFWRSPAGQPGWARPALLAIAALAAVLYGWNLRSAGFAPFYAVAVKSMSVSWKAFVFGALDPGATITIDKLAGSFLPQALSARLFGFHQWSLALPQVIEGVVSVLAMYRIVRRWVGAHAGLIAAAMFAFTPIVASMFGHSMEDGALTMCLVLAADSYQRAALEGRARSLLWAGVWVGLGFQAKMMQAWLILPALGLGYLLCAPPRLRRRLAHLLLAGVVTLAVSLSWIALYTFTPAKDRPYVDGSTNNSAVAMVFGYNGFSRFGISVPGSVGGFGAPGAQRQGADPVPERSVAGASLPVTARQGGPGPGGGAGDGPAKLVSDRYGSQIGWLYPLALLTLVVGLFSRRRAPRTDPVRGGLVMWGVWLATAVAVFSVITIPHTAYMATLAPPLAALAGAGVPLLWRAHRNARVPWLLPTVIALEAGWTVYLASAYPEFLPWLRPAVVALAVLAIAALLAGRRRAARRTAGQHGVPARGRLVRLGLVTGVVAMLVTPSAWASSVLDARYAGSSFDAGAGPSTGFGPFAGSQRARLGGGGGLPFGGPSGAAPAMPDGAGGMAGGPFGQPGQSGQPPQSGEPGRSDEPGQAGRFAPRGGIGGLGDATETLDASQQRLIDYLRAHRDGASFLFATDSWNAASPYITATGERVMPMGGFSGSVPQPTLAQVKALVAAGKLHYILLSGERGGGGGGFAGGGTVSEISGWARSACTTVAPSDYGGQAQTADNTSEEPAAGFGFGSGAGSGQTLVRCD